MYKTLIAIFALLCACAIAPAQTKINLQTQVQGNLNANGWATNLTGQTFYTEGSSFERGYELTGAQLANGGLTGNFSWLLYNDIWEAGNGTYYNDAVDATDSTETLARYTTGNNTYNVTVPSPHSVSPNATCPTFATNPSACPRGIFYVSTSVAFNSAEHGISQAQTISDLTNEVADAHADGYYPVVALLMPDHFAWGGGSPIAAYMDAINQAFRNGTIPSDMVFDIGTVLGNQYGPEYNADHIHMTLTGHTEVAQALNAFMIAGGDPHNTLSQTFHPASGQPRTQTATQTISGNGNIVIASFPINLATTTQFGGFGATCWAVFPDPAGTQRAEEEKITVTGWQGLQGTVSTDLVGPFEGNFPIFGNPTLSADTNNAYLTLPIQNYVGSTPEPLIVTCDSDSVNPLTVLPGTTPTGATANSDQVTRHATNTVPVTGNGTIVIAKYFQPSTLNEFGGSCWVRYPDPAGTNRAAEMLLSASGIGYGLGGTIFQAAHHEAAPASSIFGAPTLTYDGSFVYLSVPIQNYVSPSSGENSTMTEYLEASCTSDDMSPSLVLPGGSPGSTAMPTNLVGISPSGGLQITTGFVQPACKAATEGTFWYAKGSSSANGAVQVCQDQSGTYSWVTH